MSSLHRLLDVQVGLHADALDFLTAPAAFRRVMLKGGGDSLKPPPFGANDRNDILSLDGRGFVDQHGGLALESLLLPLEFKGVHDNDGAAVANAAAWYAKMEQGEILTSIFGAEPAATASAAPTVNSTGHDPAAGELGVSGTALVAGQIVLFQTSSGPRTRQVVSFGGGVAVFDRPYTGTPTSSSTIIRAAVWSWSPSARNHVHMGVRGEDSQQLTTWLGCAPESAEFTFEPGQSVKMNASFMPTTATPAAAKLSPSITYPNAGQPILAVNSEFLIGAETFVPYGVGLSMNTGNVMRETLSGPDGRLGGTQEEKRGNVTLSCALRIGSSLARGEVRRDTGTETLRTLLGLNQDRGDLRNVRDIALAIGRKAGGAAYLRIPDANVRPTAAVDGGSNVINLEIMPTTAMYLGVL